MQIGAEVRFNYFLLSTALLFSPVTVASADKEIYPVLTKNIEIDDKLTSLIQTIAEDYEQELALGILAKSFLTILETNLHDPQALHLASSSTALGAVCIAHFFDDPNKASKASKTVEKEVFDTFKKRVHYGSYNALRHGQSTRMPSRWECSKQDPF